MLHCGAETTQCPRTSAPFINSAYDYLILTNFANACAFTPDDMDLALASTWRDFEDGCLNQAAHKVKPDAIVTGNVKDFALSDFPVLDCNCLFDCIMQKVG